MCNLLNNKNFRKEIFFMINYEPPHEKVTDEIPNAETLEAMKEAEEIVAAWIKRKHG